MHNIHVDVHVLISTRVRRDLTAVAAAPETRLSTDSCAAALCPCGHAPSRGQSLPPKKPVNYYKGFFCILTESAHVVQVYCVHRNTRSAQLSSLVSLPRARMSRCNARASHVRASDPLGAPRPTLRLYAFPSRVAPTRPMHPPMRTVTRAGPHLAVVVARVFAAKPRPPSLLWRVPTDRSALRCCLSAHTIQREARRPASRRTPTGPHTHLECRLQLRRCCGFSFCLWMRERHEQAPVLERYGSEGNYLEEV